MEISSAQKSVLGAGLSFLRCASNDDQFHGLGGPQKADTVIIVSGTQTVSFPDIAGPQRALPMKAQP